MEEDWWADDAPENSVPDAPKEVVISGPVESGNMLKGGVNQISEDGQKGVLGHADQQGSSRSKSWILFLTGLIVIPVLLAGITTFVGITIESDRYDEEYSIHPVKIDNVTIDDRTFETYAFTVSPDFHHDFDVRSWWDISIQGENWNSWTGAYYFGDPELQAVDSQGSQWESMQTSSWAAPSQAEPPEVYIRIESSTVYVALNLNECSVCGQPEYFSYFSEDNSGNEDFITMVLCFLWPVTIIAGIIWGYATGRRPFAYGLMSFIALIGIGAMLLFGLLVMALGW